MSERDGYPPGAPCWVDTLSPDPQAAARFYGGLFGWEFVGPGRMPAAAGMYLVAQVRGRDVAGVATLPPGAPNPRSWNTYVSVASANAVAAKVKAAGGSVVLEPIDALPAGRLAVLADPAGATFCVWEPYERKGAQLINEAGAWAMSTLTTADAKGAAAFYGAVFGWTTEAFGPAEAGITLFRLPGYVGGEPEQPVSREVVASMMPGQEAPRWGVDFWVSDVEEAAKRASQGGGSVLVPPFATPIGQMAVLADLHGASFTVSKVAGRR